MPSSRTLACLFLAAGVWTAAATAAQPAQVTEVRPPARSGLLAVPLPRLDRLEPAVAQQLSELHRSFSALAGSAGVDDADLAEAYGSLGQLYHAYEFFESAEPCYRNAAHLAPGDFQWLHLLGRLYQQTGQLEEAARFYADAIEAQPDDYAAIVYLGDVYLRLNRGAEARAQFQAALNTFPGAALNGLGEAALLEGRFAEAVRHFEAALARVPGPSRIHYSLAMAYRGLGRLEEAQASLERVGPGTVRPVDPVVDALQALLRGERVNLIEGRLAFQAGAFDTAAAAFRKAVDAAPESADARINLGSALARLNDTAGAREQYEAALRLDPANVTAHHNLGALLVQQGRDAEAVDHFRAVTAQRPDHLDAHRELSRTLLRLGRHDEAIGVLLTMISLEPGDEDALVALSIVLADQGRYREARDLLTRAYARFPDRATTATTLARLLAAAPDLSVRDGGRALDIATAVHRNDPAPIHAETVALSLAELGRCGEAANWQRQAIAAASREGDTDTTARLRNTLPRYEADSCRPPGQ